MSERPIFSAIEKLEERKDALRTADESSGDVMVRGTEGFRLFLSGFDIDLAELREVKEAVEESFVKSIMLLGVPPNLTASALWIDAFMTGMILERERAQRERREGGGK